MSLSSRFARKQPCFAALPGVRPRRSTQGVTARTRRVAASAVAAATGTLLLPRLALAQTTYVYTGGGAGTASAPVTGFFSTGFTPPLVTTASAVTTNTDTLSFGGTTGYTATDDLAVTAVLNAQTLSFSNSGAVSLLQGSGTTINLSNSTSDAINLNNTGSLLIALNLVLGAGTTITGSGNATISGNVTGTKALTMNGTGTLTLTGATNTLQDVFVKTGTLVLSGGATTSAGYSSVGLTGGDNGTLTLTGAASLNGTGQDFNISDLVNSTGTLNINSTGAVTTANSYIGKGNGTNATQGGTGTLNISSGTFNTTVLHLGAYGTSTGAINQTGGTVAVTAGGDARIGGYGGTNDVNAYGIWNLSGGTATSTANTQFGGYGIGYLNQTGGTFTLTGGYIDAGRFAGSYGLIDVSGGTFNQATAGTRLFAGENGFGVITVRGTGTITAAGGITIGNSGSTAGGILNLDGGTLNAQYINTVAGSTLGSLVDFNGGTLRPTVASTTFLTGIGAAYVYSGGAIFDTNGFAVTVAQPLLAPTGSGVSAVTVTNPGTGYVNAPVVKITGGGGTGATAVATVSGGVITGITITNPGTGYTGQPTFTLVGGQANGTGAAFTATLTANTSGALTKNGVGTLTLTGANTYTGGSTVNAGVLQYAAQSNVGTGLVTVNSGGTAADSAAINQAFLTTINPSSTGVVALGASSANNLDFSATGLNAPNLSLGAIGAFTYSGTLTPNGTTYLLGGGGGALTVSSALTGANSLIVGVNGTSAAGSVILTGANTYSGGTTLNGGILSIGADSFLGAVPATPTTNLTFNGGTLAATASFSLSPNRNVTIGAGGATTQVGANNLTIPGVITSTGTGTVLKTTNGDTGALVLSGNNSFASGAIIQLTGGGSTNGGILRLANSNALGTNPITINDSLGNNASLSMVQLSGGITIPSTVTLTAAGHNQTISDADLLRNVSGNNTFNGSISVIAVGGGYYIDSAAGAGTLLTFGGTFQNNVAASTRGPVFYGNGNTTATGSISNGSATALTSVAAGAANFVNTGIVTISGNNSYTGGTTAFSGTLRLGSTTAIPTGTPLTIGAAGTFDLNGQYLTAMGTTGAGLSLTTLGLTSGGMLNFDLSGNSSDQLTFTGAVVSTGGKISIGAAAGATTLTTGNYTLITDATGNSSSFTLSNTNVVIGAFAYPLSLTSTANSVVLTVGSGVLGTAYWTGSQSNTWNTGGSGAATNFSTDPAGTNNTLALPNSSTDVYFTANAATNFSSTLGQDFTINSLTMGIGASATNASTIGGANTLTINAAGGAYAAGVGITIPAANTAAQTISANVALGGAQSWSNNSTGLFTVSGTVSGAFALTTAGTGTTLLSGNNTYTGGTTVSAETLQLGSATALGAATNNVTISGGRLDEAGSAVSQNALLLTGGTLVNTGAASGLLTLTSSGGAVVIPTTVNYAATAAAVSGNLSLTGSGGTIAKASGLGNPVFTGGIALNGGNNNIALADTAGDAAAELSLTGVISGAGSLTLANNATVTGVTFANQLDYGTLLLSGTNTYTGGTNINFGRLVITSGGALGSGAVTLAQATTSGGTLQLGNTAYTATSAPLAQGTIATGITVPNAINLGGAINGDYGYGISNNNGANTLSGAITLTNANQIINVSGGSLALTGNIGQSTTATLTKNGANLLTLAPTSATANTYSGGTVIAAGELQFANDGYLGTGAVTLSGGYLGYTGATETFSLPFAGTNAGGGGFDIVNAAANFTIPNYASTGTLQKIGLGTLTLGTTTTATNTLFHAGTVVVPTGGTLTNTSYNSIGVNSGDNATLTVNGSYTVPNDFNVSDTTGSNGILNINPGAAVQGTTTYVGKSGTSTGVVNQTGGSYTQTSGNDFRIGGAFVAGDATSVGTYNLSGGTLGDPGNFQAGAFGTGSLNISGTGAATISGGGFPVVGRFTGGYGVLDVSGSGSFAYTGTNRLIVGEQGIGILNVRGSGIVTSAGSALQIGGTEATAGIVGIVNLDGGTLTAAGINTGSASDSSTLNFNGGTLQANASSTTFVSGITNAYVYSGGAKVNTNGNNDTITQALLAPTGNGLSSVNVTNGGTGYETAPVVQIMGGGGTGATAVATINSSGTITGITITNPGVGYTSTPTVTVISGTNAGYAPVGGATFSTAITANTSGGLIKTGMGALTLMGASTFAGGVNVMAGSVIAGGTAVGTGGVTLATNTTLGVGEALNSANTAIIPTSLSASTLAVTLGSSTPLLTFNLGASGMNDVLNLTSTTATDLTYSGAGVFDIGFASATGSSLSAGTYTLINFANPEAASSVPNITNGYQAVAQGNLADINNGSFSYQTNGNGNVIALLFKIGSADAMPEPGSIALTLFGLGGPLALIARRRKKA